MTKTINTVWGNSYVREVEFFESDGETPLDLTEYEIVFTVKDNLAPDNDDKAKLKVTLVNDEDQTENTGKAKLIIDKDDLKFAPESYSADFKVFHNDAPVNTEKITFNLRNVVGKDD